MKKFGQTLLCKACGTSFVVAHPRQIHCSKTCMRRMKSRRRAERGQRALDRKKERAKHGDKLRQQSREYYAENAEWLKAKQREWNAANAEYRRSVANRRYHATRAFLPWKNSLQGSKHRAKRDSIPFNLTPEWAIARWTGRCEVTGIEFVLSESRNPYLFSPSLDRIVPALGYTPSNSRFVIHAVNALKGAGTDEDMLRIAKAIVANFSLSH